MHLDNFQIGIFFTENNEIIEESSVKMQNGNQNDDIPTKANDKNENAIEEQENAFANDIGEISLVESQNTLKFFSQNENHGKNK